MARRVSLPGRDGPRWLMAVCASLCALSLAVAAALGLQGAPYVLGFAGVELALVAYARHAADRKTVTLAAHELRPVFAQELGRALRRAQAGLPPQDSELEPQR